MSNTYFPIPGGEIEFLDSMGTDLDIINAAKVSTGKLSHSFGEKERKLLSYLWAHKHTSPFEQVVFKFRIKLPIFLMRQLVRYRTARLNELSGRYAVLHEEFYIPDQLHSQDSVNKQKSGKPLSSEENTAYRLEMKSFCHHAFDTYHNLLDAGIAREQARMVLPLNTFTECVFQIDLHNLLKLLRQRLASDAQDEFRAYAVGLASYVKLVCPEVWGLLQADLQSLLADSDTLLGSLLLPKSFHLDR